jgi:hypothetical protein
MTTARRILCLLSIGLFVSMPSACAPAPPPTHAPQPQQLLGHPPAADQSTGLDPQQQSIEALRRKAESHAQEMERLRSERPRTAAAPTQVQWPQPTDEPATEPGAAADHGSTAQLAVPPVEAPRPVVHVGPPPLPRQGDPAQTAEPAVSTAASSHATADPLYQIEQRLARHVREYPRDIAAHLDYQLVQFVLGEPVPRMAELSTLPPEDQELIAAMLDGLSNFRSAVRADNNMLLSRKVRPLLQMSERLRSQADLHIPTLALCTRVDGFGVYEPIEPPRFVAGREQPAIIYTELQNFASTLNEQRRWQTRLKQQAVLYTEEGLNVWQDQSHEILDLSRNRRHDFFTVRLVRLPAALSVGRYVLKVTVIDQQANRVAEASLPIQVVAH